MSFRTGLILAVLILLGTVLVRLPARLLTSLLPNDISCDDPGGTLWQGTCGQLRSSGISIAGLSWKLHPLPLLHGTLSADVSSADPDNGARGSVEATRSGDISISELHAVLPLPPGSGPIPRGTSATLALALASAKIHDSHLVQIAGTVDLQQLRISNPRADLGSYELQFPAADSSTMTGQLRDLGGPLAVNGQLTLQASGVYEVNGTVAPRSALSPDLEKALQFMGPADASGRRQFSVAGTL
jgi:general secretion pathway protein N